MPIQIRTAKGNFLMKNVTQIVGFVIGTGTRTESRLGSVSELLNVQIEMPTKSAIYRPGMSPRLGLVELMQVVSGYFDERTIRAAAPGLVYPYGLTHAYGIKIAQQVPKVIRQLRTNSETRRALIHIGKPEDGQEQEKPCIQTVQFQLRDGKLYTTVFVRSWDVVSGLPYDVVVINGLAQIIAACIGAEPFSTNFFIGSAHVYHDAWLKVWLDYPEKMGNVRFDEFTVNTDIINIFYDYSDFDSWREWAIDCLNDFDLWKKHRPYGVTYR